MPSITRRTFVGASLATAAGAYGTYRLYRGATDATFDPWAPTPGTWPLPRYDPANTAHNPDASPPRETLVVAGERRKNGERAGGVVRAYDVASGDALWTHTFEERPGGLALVEDRVIVTAGTALYALA